MGVARFDDGVPSNTKIIDAGATASWLWFCGVLYCRRGLTDGYIPHKVVPSLSVGLKAPYSHAVKLVEVGLWTQSLTGYYVHDYLDWNPSKAQVEGYRAKDRDRKQAKHGVRVDSRSESERKPDGEAVTTRARTKSESECMSESEDRRLKLSEESARETTTVAPIWRKREGNPPALLGGGSSGHLHCFDAPGACARGWCIPHFLGQNFVTQAGAGDYAAGVLHVAAFVAHTLATTLEGPIGDPLPFWRGKWHLAHGAAIAKPVAGKGISTLEAAQRVAAKRIAREEGR